jgi:DNA-binding NarL/FixJ family response regulator
MIKVLIFEDNPELRSSLVALIGGTDGFTVPDTYAECTGAAEAVGKHDPDVVIMDIDMPGMSGLDGLQQIKNNFPQVNVLMLTVFDDDENVFKALQNGATGYLLKKTSPAKILEAITEARDGGAPMTPSVARKVLGFFPKNKTATIEEFDLTVREREVLALFVDGFSYKMAAEELGISVFTIQDYVKSIYRKLHVHSLPAAVAKAIHNKVV